VTDVAPSTKALASAFAQFLIGAGTWAAGQRHGALSCTGLGYWIIFDALGLGIYGWISKGRFGDAQSELRRPFGAKRIETTALFAQSIYLLFTSVYVLKEAVEHIMLSASSAAEHTSDSHHHHHSSDASESMFPSTFLWLPFFSLILSSAIFDNHSKLAGAAGHSLPSLSSLLQTTQSPFHMSLSAMYRIFSNPFTLSPLVFTSCLIFTAYFIETAHHPLVDLLVSSLETVVTFSLAYPAAIALGKVLLQTAPERGLPAGQTEAFLRVMRELERHPQILHLPAPHLWQLTPAAPSSVEGAGAAELVATVELHVKPEVDDATVLELTKYVWEKCTAALGREHCGGVTVGVVRG